MMWVTIGFLCGLLTFKTTHTHAHTLTHSHRVCSVGKPPAYVRCRDTVCGTSRVTGVQSSTLVQQKDTNTCRHKTKTSTTVCLHQHTYTHPQMHALSISVRLEECGYVQGYRFTSSGVSSHIQVCCGMSDPLLRPLSVSGMVWFVCDCVSQVSDCVWVCRMKLFFTMCVMSLSQSQTVRSERPGRGKDHRAPDAVSETDATSRCRPRSHLHHKVNLPPTLYLIYYKYSFISIYLADDFVQTVRKDTRCLIYFKEDLLCPFESLDFVFGLF